MKRPNFNNLIHQRRIVIGFQLLVLVLILSGIFVGLRDTSTDVDQELIVLDDLPVTGSLDKDSNTPNIQAQAAFVYDVHSNQVIYSHNSDAVLPLASITKLMTTLVAYEITQKSDIASISRRSVLQDGHTGLNEGELISIESLYQLSLISSSNDAAFALADNVGEMLGSEDSAAQFVAAMNIRAEELGLDTLEFFNPTGLDVSETEPGAVGSAEDVSQLLGFLVTKYPELIEPTQHYQTRVYNESGSYHDVENTNDVLFSIPNLLASKTGYTDLAGGNLTVAYDAGFNRPIVVTVLGSTHSGRFNDVLELIDYANSQLK